MKAQTKIRITVYLPQTRDGCTSLRRQIASVHAVAVCQHISQLACPPDVKSRLADAIRDQSR